MPHRKRKPVLRVVEATAEIANLDELAADALNEIFEAADRSDLTAKEFRELCRQIAAKHLKTFPK